MTTATVSEPKPVLRIAKDPLLCKQETLSTRCTQFQKQAFKSALEEKNVTVTDVFQHIIDLVISEGVESVYPILTKQS